MLEYLHASNASWMCCCFTEKKQLLEGKHGQSQLLDGTGKAHACLGSSSLLAECNIYLRRGSKVYSLPFQKLYIFLKSLRLLFGKLLPPVSTAQKRANVMCCKPTTFGPWFLNLHMYMFYPGSHKVQRVGMWQPLIKTIVLLWILFLFIWSSASTCFSDRRN